MLRGVVISDIINSSKLQGSSRDDLDRHLKKLFSHFNKKYLSELSADFDYTLGDEFEAVFTSPELAIRPVLLMHAWLASQLSNMSIRVRSAIGVGRITTANSRKPSRQDGPAFHVARNLINDIHFENCSLGIVCEGTSPFAESTNIGLRLGCRTIDSIISYWTLAQWEAAYWRFEGLTYVEISKHLNVASQNVAKRLKSGRYEIVKSSISDIELLLKTFKAFADSPKENIQ